MALVKIKCKIVTVKSVGNAYDSTRKNPEELSHWIFTTSLSFLGPLQQRFLDLVVKTLEHLRLAREVAFAHHPVDFSCFTTAGLD